MLLLSHRLAFTTALILAVFTLSPASARADSPAPAPAAATPAGEAAPPDIAELLKRIPETDGWDRYFVQEAAYKFFNADAFARLEELGALLRAKPMPVFLDGTPALNFFYAGLSSVRELENHDPENPKASSAPSRYQRWAAAFPDSPVRPVAEADAWTDYAWNARGGGWGYTVSQGGWDLFGKRLAIARSILESAPALCPHHAATLQTVALGQGWEREEYEALFERAVKANPTYLPYYFRKSVWLLPRWHGETGELEKWARAEASSGRAGAGRSIYARIHLSQINFIDDEFRWSPRSGGFDWSLTREACQDLLKSTPGSLWNRIAYARFAWLARDRDTFRHVLADVKPGHYGQPFGAGETDIARRWADLPTLTPTGAPSVASYHATEKIPAPVEALAISPDGKQIAAGDRFGSLRVFDADLRPVRREQLGRRVIDLAWSPDGSTLAASLAPLGSKSPVLVETYDAATLRRRATSDEIFTEPRCLRYAPDGRLFLGGGPHSRKPELHLVSADGSTRVLDWFAKHSHDIRSVSFSPDSSVLVTSCNRGLSYHDANTGAELFATQAQLRGWVEVVATSPDGAWTAVGTRGSRSSDLALWDERGDRKRKPAHQIQRIDGGYYALAWSHDSRLLAYAGEDGLVNVHDVAACKTIATFTEHLGVVTGLAWSPDGSRLYSSSHDGSVRAWTGF